MATVGEPVQNGDAGASSLVGRKRELATLRVTLRRSLQGEGSLVLISGEAGIGKTSLVQHLLREAGDQDALVLAGAAYDLSTTPPYGPWLEMSDRYHADDSLPELPEVRKRGTCIGDLQDQRELFEAVLQFLKEVSKVQPLILALEDLHWADQASLDTLRFIARKIDGQRILIVATYRDDEITRRHPLFQLLPALIRESRTHRIELGALDPEAVRALVTARYSLSPEDHVRLVDYLLMHAEGNPLFTVEVLRTLEQGGSLRQNPKGWQLADLRQLPVPALVRQVIERRIAHLGDDARHVMEIAATIGHQVPIDLWQEVARVSEDELAVVTGQSMDLHLLEASPDDNSLSFVHALTREALYQSIAPPRKRSFHRMIAEALASSLSNVPDTVAYHFQRASDPRAVEWLIRAGLQARRSSAWLTAADRFHLAARMLAGDEERIHERGWILFFACYLSRYVDYPNALDDLLEVEHLAARSEDHLLAGYAIYHRGTARCHRGNIIKGIQEIEHGLSMLEQLRGDHFILSTDEQALKVIEGLLPEHTLGTARPSHPTRKTPRYSPQRGILINWLALAGRYREALALGEAFVEDYNKELGDKYLRNRQCVSGILGLANAYAALGRPEDALAQYAFAAKGFASVGDNNMLEYCLLCELFMVLIPFYADHHDKRRQALSMAADAWGQARGLSADDIAISRSQILYDTLHGRWENAKYAAILRRNSVLPVKSEWSALFIGMLDLYQGHFESAWSHVNNLLPEGPNTEAGDHRFAESIAVQGVAIALSLDSGELATARSWIEAQERWLDWSSAYLWQAENNLLWARYYQRSDDLSRARQHAEQALIQAGTPRQPLILLQAHRFLGELGTQEKQYGKAEQQLRESLRLAEACAIPFERALTLLALAELCAAVGDNYQTQSLLEEVIAICAPLSAKPTLDRAEALANRLQDKPTRTANPAGITQREGEVLRLIAHGRSNREIAAELFISTRTVERHIENLYRKLDIHSRIEAIDVGRRHPS